jgi:anhydro-N-acetylmuramic acid kinase
MATTPMRRVIGLMSGTSLDGIDAALVVTDGCSRIEPGPSITVPYEAAFRARLRGVLGGTGDVAAVERELTDAHAEAVRALIADHDLGAVDLLGFHGHTILHRPREGRTWQIGDGARLAAATGIDVVADFRSADVAAGGEGAPFVPLYHQALARDLPHPVAVLNLGGVANVTWIGWGEGNVIAFDTGPGNALIDDWMLRHTGRAVDADGASAARGKVDESEIRRFLTEPYFDRWPPKSLDRNEFAGFRLDGLGLEDGAATLTAMTAAAVAVATQWFPEPVWRWLVTGGGRRNPTLMAMLTKRLAAEVDAVEDVGWDGDALEAQAFAYLAVRSLEGLPLSLPTTTGVRAPTLGGRLFRTR